MERTVNASIVPSKDTTKTTEDTRMAIEILKIPLEQLDMRVVDMERLMNDTRVTLSGMVHATDHLAASHHSAL
jgi:hypothetical protein